MRFAFLLLLLNYFVAVSQNNLNIISEEQRISVSLNGSLVNKTPQAIVTISAIKHDTLNLRVEIENNGYFNQTIYLLNKKERTKHVEFNYLVNTGKKTLSYLGNYELDKLINFSIPPKPIEDTSYKYSNNILEHFCEIKNDKPEYFNNKPNGPCLKPMPDSYTGYAVVLISKAQTPDQKYNILESVFRNNCVTVKQTRFMLDFISFEVERLKLLKSAYPSIVDKNNLEQLSSSFKFDASKNELSMFLKENKNKKETIYEKCTVASNLSEVDQFIGLLSVCSNDGERTLLFNKQYNDFCVTTETAAKILNTFIHDREKLDSSKLLYFKCVDKQNYRMVGGVFSYKESESELLGFIEKQEK